MGGCNTKNRIVSLTILEEQSNSSNNNNVFIKRNELFIKTKIITHKRSMSSIENTIITDNINNNNNNNNNIINNINKNKKIKSRQLSVELFSNIHSLATNTKSPSNNNNNNSLTTSPTIHPLSDINRSICSPSSSSSSEFVIIHPLSLLSINNTSNNHNNNTTIENSPALYQIKLCKQFKEWEQHMYTSVYLDISCKPFKELHWYNIYPWGNAYMNRAYLSICYCNESHNTYWTAIDNTDIIPWFTSTITTKRMFQVIYGSVIIYSINKATNSINKRSFFTGEHFHMLSSFWYCWETEHNKGFLLQEKSITSSSDNHLQALSRIQFTNVNNLYLINLCHKYIHYKNTILYHLS